MAARRAARSATRRATRPREEPFGRKAEPRGFEWAEGVFSGLESAEEPAPEGVTPDPVHVLILDATGSPGPLRKWWPRLELLGDVRAMDAPGVVRCQLSDSAMSYSKCVPKPERPDDDRRAAETARTLRMISELRRIQAGGRAGFIGPKALVALYEENGLGFDDGTVANWLGNIRGSNAMTGVSSLVVASRPARPRPRTLERNAAVLFGCDVTPEETRDEWRRASRRSRATRGRDDAGRDRRGASWWRDTATRERRP